MKKYICLFLSTLMFLTIFSPVNCYARDGKKVIRVGFYTMDNYQECDENGNYSGYFVDYLREISQYTGWEYEFIQMNCLKTVILCILIFFGAAFTIMAFNNDVGVTDVFAKFYQQITGMESNGITELEICYSIGLAVGIIVFFNHVGHKKITHDPTPIQIEMRKYETDLDTAFINNAERRGHSVDVD